MRYMQLYSYAVIFCPLAYLECFLTKYIVTIYIVKFILFPFHTLILKLHNCITV